MPINRLKMTFDPATIEHLGVRMYSTLPPVLAELIANSYDADAETVYLTLKDDSREKEIIIKDDGIGMSFSEINDKFLRIGRNRREEDGDKLTPKSRKAIGKKGLGKLSFFGIAHEIEISTKKSGKWNVFIMRWEDIKKSHREYKPLIVKENERCDIEEHGTTIILRKIQRESEFSAEDIANSLSKIFIIDPDFKILVGHNSEPAFLVSNERKYLDLEREIEWDIPKDLSMKTDYKKIKEVKGHLIATEKPISPKTNMRGITLFSRKKLVNSPEYFSESISSHFFSYLTGWLEVDFIDDIRDDVISTNRQSLNWSHPEMRNLRSYLQELIRWLEKDWREKRNEKQNKKITEETGINIPDWFNKLPPELRVKVQPIVQAIAKDSELPEEIKSSAVKTFHEIIPEYPYYHWRHLHSEIRSIAKEDYESKRYFDAAEKASRLYCQRVKEKSEIDTENDSNAMDDAFNPGNGILLVTECSNVTERNIQNGQQFLSKGIVAGCRNPLTHNPEYQKKLVDTGLFTEKDCLDMLSVISHLFTRLDNSKKRN